MVSAHVTGMVTAKAAQAMARGALVKSIMISGALENDEVERFC